MRREKAKSVVFDINVPIFVEEESIRHRDISSPNDVPIEFTVHDYCQSVLTEKHSEQLNDSEFYFNATDIALEAIMNVGRRSNVV